MSLSRMTSFQERLIVALDFPSAGEAMTMVKQLSPLGITFKVGMQLFYQGGIALVHALQAQKCSLFLDLKLHDIPNTVARATEVLVKQGVGFLNVHAQGGREMMQAAVEAGRITAEKNGFDEPIIIAVTLLTSLSQEALSQDLNIQESPEEYVVRLATMAQESGMSGVVCSPQESARLRKECGPGFLLVTPGVRPAGSETNDQSRIMTPADALKAGSDFIVVGRPITHATHPVKAAEKILEEMETATLRPWR